MLETARPWLRLLFWVLVAAIVVFGLRELMPLLSWCIRVLEPFLIALIVAYVFNPIVSFVQKELRLPRVLGIMVLMLFIAGVLIGVMIWLVPVLYQQVATAVNDIYYWWIAKDRWISITNYLERHNITPQTINQIRNKLDDMYYQLKSSLDDMLSAIGKPAAQGGLSILGGVAGGVAGVVGGVTGFLITTGFVIVISFYYLIEMDAFPSVIRRLLPARQRDAIWDILSKANYSVGGFLRGQLIACIIVAILTSILLFFIRMKQYAILIGCIAGIMHLVPYLGPIAGGTPAILFVLLSQQFTTLRERGFYILAVLIGFSLIETFDGLVTQPFIVGKRASLHPLTVMLALLVGAQFGLGGMAIAVPSACFARVLWLELFWKKRIDHPIADPPDAADPPAADSVAAKPPDGMP